VSDETGMKAPTLFTTMYIHAAPQDAVLASMRRTWAIGRFWHHRTSAIQDRANGFRRKPLPRTPVNKSPRRTLGQAEPAGSWPRCLWAGYLRTRSSTRASAKTLWELCTMIPISALR
jgi:hypothetical protein